ncbi:hypothetical protein [Aliikangiella sp. IMCC44359]|uniref:hypothetical protein n=1 Tax=Aliikangiella sp. IMCC44359 TaxID=3459125 RepID=UPI00403B37DA
MNSKKREVVLLAILMLLILSYVLKQYGASTYPEQPTNLSLSEKKEVFSPLEINNEFKIKKIKNEGVYYTKLVISYSYNGSSGKKGLLLIKPNFNNVEDVEDENDEVIEYPLKLGSHRSVINLKNPCGEGNPCEASSIDVEFVNKREYYAKRFNDNLSSIKSSFNQHINTPIKWALSGYSNNKQPIESRLNMAIYWLDTGKNSDIRLAKKTLDSILLDDPKNVQAYIEMARYHMKISWGEVGLKRAEEILDSAMQIDNSIANIYVLRGYVYTHQKRYSLAEIDFVKAKQIGTNNLWLYANWGEFYQKQNKLDEALNYYQQVISAKREKRSNNKRPKIAVYHRLENIYMDENKIDELDQLLEKKSIEFSENACNLSYWANVKLYYMGQTQTAHDLAFRGLSLGCDNTKYAKRVYADTLFALWNEKTIDKNIKVDLYNKGIALDLNWASRLYRFATNKYLEPVFQSLIKNKVNINEVDLDGHTVLSYAVLNNNSKVITKLIKMNADPNQKLQGESTVFFLALVSSNIETINAIIDSKVDLVTTFDNGVTADYLASQRGFHKVATKLRGGV